MLAKFSNLAVLLMVKSKNIILHRIGSRSNVTAFTSRSNQSGGFLFYDVFRKTKKPFVAKAQIGNFKQG